MTTPELPITHAQVKLKDDLELKGGFDSAMPSELRSTGMPHGDWASFIDGCNLILQNYSPGQLFRGSWLAGASAAVLTPITTTLNRETLMNTEMNLATYIAEWNNIYFHPRNLRVDFVEQHVGPHKVETHHHAKHIWRQVFRLGTGDTKRYLDVHNL